MHNAAAEHDNDWKSELERNIRDFTKEGSNKLTPANGERLKRDWKITPLYTSGDSGFKLCRESHNH